MRRVRRANPGVETGAKNKSGDRDGRKTVLRGRWGNKMERVATAEKTDTIIEEHGDGEGG
jgi:hypothetical protein